MITTNFIMHGFHVFVDDNLCKRSVKIQFRFPKSKKKRIRNKWSKRDANFKYESREQVIKIDNKIIISRNAYESMRPFFKENK